MIVQSETGKAQGKKEPVWLSHAKATGKYDRSNAVLRPAMAARGAVYDVLS
jgi:hypothetical protein